MRLNPRNENYEQARRRMIEETCRFIEWGLQNPEEVTWIPRHPVGRGGFSERVKMIFWTLMAHEKGPADSAEEE